MATVVSITNPITGAVEQVDKLDHTAQQIDDAVSIAPQLSNPNLLDNWYFGNPVNQRGQTEHYGYGYFIDRWILSEGKCSISESGMTIFVDNTNTWVSQRIDAPVENQIVTVSALMSDGKLYSASGRVTKTQEVTKVFDDGGYIRCLYDSGIAMHVFNIGRFDASSPLTVIAVKLELGSQQTLAHKDADGNWVLNEIPNYGEQLRRCQRYFQTFATESLRPTNALDFRPVMRTNPALSTIAVGGKTLYTASADL